MQYFWYSLLSTGLFYALGLGFTIFLLPDSLRRYTLIIAPWVGYCYVGLISWHVFYYGGHLSRHSARMMLIAPIVCLAAALLRKRRGNIRAVLDAPTLAGLGMAAIGFVVVSIPVFRLASSLTTVSLGNNDIVTYSALARYLSEFTRLTTEGFIGQTAGTPDSFEWAARAFYFGSPAFLAFQGKLLGLMPHQYTSLCLFLLLAFGAAVIFLLLTDVFHLKWRPALLGVGFVIFHPVMQFISWEGFLAQVAATGLALLIFWANTKLFDGNSSGSDKIRVWLLLVVFTTGALLNYSHMLPFIWLFVLIYAGVLAFLNKSSYAIKACLLANASAALATAILCPQRVLPSLQVLKVYASVVAGWFIPWMAPNYLAGLMFQNPFLGPVQPEPAHFALSILVVVTFAFALWVAYRNGFRELIALGVGCVALYAACLVLAWTGRQNEVLGGYRSFKLASFFLPLFVTALVGLAAVLKTRYKMMDLAIKWIAVVAVVISYAMASRTMLMRQFAKVEPAFDVLAGLERTQSVESINILGENFWRSMWTTYFLLHKKQYFENQNYYARSELIGDYDLEDKLNARSQIVQVKSIETPAVRTLNERFTLVGPLHQRVRAKLGTGWYRGEIGHVWSGKDNKRASIILHSLDEGVRVRLRLVCVPLRKNDSLLFQFRERYVSSSTDNHSDGSREIVVPELKLGRGDNEVVMISGLNPIQAHAKDPRLLSHSFTSVVVEEL